MTVDSEAWEQTETSPGTNNLTKYYDWSSTQEKSTFTVEIPNTTTITNIVY